jgi:glycosyltransferase involved in cell wall biosynthesis
MSEIPSNWEPQSLSIVIPVFDEADNVERLVEANLRAAQGVGLPFELILVDVGSRDDTRLVLQRMRTRIPELVVVFLRRNFGQTLALLAGFDQSRGDVVVTMDGDLQNDPRDIPILLDEIRHGADAVSGWRRNRKDGWTRLLPSRVANWLIRRLTRVEIHDQGCALKAYRGELVRSLGLYADMHRFIATLTLPLGARIAEVEVRHHPRTAGASHYGISRVLRVMADLLTLQMLTRFREWPLRWFTFLGIPFFLSSTLASGMALIGDPESTVVWAAISFLTISTFGTCLLLGLLGEAALEVSGPKQSRPVIRRQWGRP